MSIVNYDVRSLIEQWMEAERNGEQFPVPFHERFIVLMSALSCANESIRNAKTLKECLNVRRLVDKVGKLRRNISLPSSIEHDILIEMIDAVDTALVFHCKLFCEKYNDGCVYFLLNKITNQVKIGWTVKLSERIKTLSTQSGMDFVLLGFFIANNQSAESEMHKKFAHLRQKGEWFKYEGCLKEFIAEKF